MLAEITAFFILVCQPTPQSAVDEKCFIDMYNCWADEMQKGATDHWSVAEGCSELFYPSLNKPTKP